jgi:phosphatidylethanolamine-binding protein (PEBP) family uncharacterized protein
MRRLSAMFLALLLVAASGAAVAQLAAQAPAKITVESPAFKNGAPIPAEYTADGKNTSPAINWSNVPSGTRELALIMDDPDAPTPVPFVHWVVYKIPASATGLPAGVPPGAKIESGPAAGAIQGVAGLGGGRGGRGGRGGAGAPAAGGGAAGGGAAGGGAGAGGGAAAGGGAPAGGAPGGGGAAAGGGGGRGRGGAPAAPGYRGPAPPAGKPHNYNFKVYALNAPLEVEEGLNKDALLKAMEGKIIGEGLLIGVYERKQ